MQKILFSIAGACLVLVAGVGAFLYTCEDDWCFLTEWQKVRAADSFERCAQLGFPVMESYPRQCRAGDKLFVEQAVPAAPAQDAESLRDDIRVDVPLSGALIESPLRVSGAARGNWYFEASFPATLLDGEGNELARVPATAEGEWMTADFVPFAAELKWSAPGTKTGTLVFAKDNPSGLPEHDASIRIPVRFALYKSGAQFSRTVELYYYNPKNDRDRETDTVRCTEGGLVPLERTIASTKTPITDTVKLLLLGLVSDDERIAGVSSEFPLAGFTLTSAQLQGGVLTLAFSDPHHLTQGGACRTSLLRSQIERTVQQFSAVREVRFAPEELFQP